MKRPSLYLPVHADAGIPDDEFDVTAGGHTVCGDGAVSRFQIACFEQELPAVGHRIAGVDGEIQDDLFHLTGVGEDRSQIRRELRRDRDVLADQAAKEFFHSSDNVIQLELAGLDSLLSAEGEELSRKCYRALCGLLNLIQMPAEF